MAAAGTTYKGLHKGHALRAWWRRRLRGWPFLFWIAAIATVLILYQRSGKFGHMLGAVEAIEEPIAPLDTSRLISIGVVVGQHVKAGDPIAQMDTSRIADEIAINRATLVEAQDTITDYQQRIVQMKTQTERALQEAETAYLAEKARKESLTAQLKILTEEQARRDALAAQRMINVRDASELRPQIAALQKEIEHEPDILASHERVVSAIRRQTEEQDGWLRLNAGQDLNAALKDKMDARNAVIQSTITMLENRAAGYTLRATRDGVVSQIDATPGDVINSGVPIARLVAENPQHVIGFLPEVHLSDLQVGQKILVWRSMVAATKVPAVIVSIAPDVRQLPGRVSSVAGQTLRGRRVVAKFEGPHHFISGETVEIGLPPPSLKVVILRMFGGGQG